ncbi:MAG: phosphoribosylanthranilate isomerase [Lentisphaeria bacterium]|nr:phosphoribosylanthranilate isomerase [Lentisphaeria bacterium]
MTLLVKICGLTRPEDVRLAVEAGADALGFVLVPTSPRFVKAASLPGLTAAVPEGVLKVGVVVHATAAEVAEAVRLGGLDVIQFHGDEEPSRLAAFRLATAWKAVTLRRAADVEAAVPLPAAVLVADAGTASMRGGTGRTCDWSLAAALARRRRTLLAGGLTLDNVAAAIAAVRPHGVDVSSGLEAAPGIKDPTRLREFIHRARAAAAGCGADSGDTQPQAMGTQR